MVTIENLHKKFGKNQVLTGVDLTIAEGGIFAVLGPNGSGNPTAKYPALAGQHATYTIKQLNMFRDGSRDNDANKMMRNIAAKMSTAEIEAVANYIAQMK